MLKSGIPDRLAFVGFGAAAAPHYDGRLHGAHEAGRAVARIQPEFKRIVAQVKKLNIADVRHLPFILRYFSSGVEGKTCDRNVATAFLTTGQRATATPNEVCGIRTDDESSLVS